MRRTAEMVLVTVMFPVVWVATRTEVGKVENGPVRLRELWDYHKRFWHGAE